MNKVVLEGFLAQDPVVFNSENGKKVVKLTIAARKDYEVKEGEANADFIPVTAFGKQAEEAEKNFKRGTLVNILGVLRVGKYTDKNGIERNELSVIVRNAKIVEKKASSKDDGPDAA